MKTSLEIFAQNLRDTLEAQRKSQSGLARHTGATTVSVSRWVNAQSMPRANMLDKICQYLNCTAEDLLTDHSKVAVMLPQDILAEEIENNPRLMRLMFYFMKLSDAELDKEIERISRK